MMTKAIRGVLAAACIATVALSGAAVAQSSNFVEKKGDWSAHQASSPKECWAVTEPTSWNATNNGNRVEVNRGKIYLFVTWRPGKSAEVSFAGGYPFAPGSVAELSIGGATYKLFTEGENAWAASSGDDAKIIGALKAGATAKITARSARGNVTHDTFSLAGSSAAFGIAESRCK